MYICSPNIYGSLLQATPSNNGVSMGQVDWPKYFSHAMQIALISDFADELVVTHRSRGYEPPFIPQLGNQVDSMGIKDVSVTDVDAQR